MVRIRGNDLMEKVQGTTRLIQLSFFLCCFTCIPNSCLQITHTHKYIPTFLLEVMERSALQELIYEMRICCKMAWMGNVLL